MNRGDHAAKFTVRLAERGGTVFYDAECGLCRACVRWLRRADTRGRLSFAPLQVGEELWGGGIGVSAGRGTPPMLEFGGPLVGRGRPDRSSALLADGTPDAIVEPDFLRENELLPKASEDFDSMVFIPDRVRIGKPEFLLRTDALVAALRACGGSAAFWGKLLKLAPRGLRDLGYRLVARYRHRFFSD